MFKSPTDIFSDGKGDNRWGIGSFQVGLNLYNEPAIQLLELLHLRQWLLRIQQLLLLLLNLLQIPPIILAQIHDPLVLRHNLFIQNINLLLQFINLLIIHVQYLIELQLLELLLLLHFLLAPDALL